MSGKIFLSVSLQYGKTVFLPSSLTSPYPRYSGSSKNVSISTGISS
uniref:Uncharacterized protein n=1 Tax=virus sp. ctnRj46 TaxID=2826814 RepID=A0A8S5R7T5_9VIRU|nr:MAG TPA: hypothetical protein [virus sp. ctnRj46]